MNSTPLAMNTAGAERRLLQNIHQNHALSCNCSALIDVSVFDHYNMDMDKNPVVTLIAIENAAPKRRISRSAGAVYLMLIALMIGCISIGNLLYLHWQIPRVITQPALYALIAGCGVYLYRRHYLRYRYTLTNEMFSIERIGLNGEKMLAAVSIADIRHIDRKKTKRATGRIIRASLPPTKAAPWISARIDGAEYLLQVGVSESFLEKLIAQWQGVSMQGIGHANVNAPRCAEQKER